MIMKTQINRIYLMKLTHSGKMDIKILLHMLKIILESINMIFITVPNAII